MLRSEGQVSLVNAKKPQLENVTSDRCRFDDSEGSQQSEFDQGGGEEEFESEEGGEESGERDSGEAGSWGWDDPDGPDGFVDEPVNDWGYVRWAPCSTSTPHMHYWPAKKFSGPRKTKS